VAVRRQEVAEPEVHLLQRGRERAGDVQRSRPHGAQPAPALRGLPHRLPRDRAKVAYIYIRGELLHVQHILARAIDDAYQAGHLGKNIYGSGFDCDVFMHRGAGAYEAGEETALIESLEGKRAQPRLKPPFPAVAGLYGCPTAVNNVETLCNVPLIIERGAEWFAKIGPEKNGGPKLFCVSGHVKRAGTYEASMDVSLKELIYGESFAGGIRGGHALKCVIPGGSSVPVLLPDEIDIPASFDGIAKAGSLLGSAGIIVGRDDAWCGRRRTRCTSTSTSRAASARQAARVATGCTGFSARSSAARAR
jgi:NADH:ubiquinone oxidoreductase subunit F (NADH-binding)